MEIKVTKAVGSDSKTASTLDLFEGVALPDDVKSRVKQDVGDYLVEAILSSAHKATSPIDGEGAFAPLSPVYKAKKLADGLPGKANLEYSGDLLDSLTFNETRNGIEIGWFGSEAGKADGHNNLSGDSLIPTRRLIPDMGQSFDSSITEGIDKIISDAIADSFDFKRSDFVDVTTKQELYDALDEYFPGLSRTEIRGVVARSPDLADLLDSLDLFGML